MPEFEQKITQIQEKYSKEGIWEERFNKIAGVQNKVEAGIIALGIFLPAVAPYAVIAGIDAISNYLGKEKLKERRQSMIQKEITQVQQRNFKKAA